MRRPPSWLPVLSVLLAGAALAQPLGTPADAFQAGQAFAQPGAGAAAALVNRQTGQASLPGFGSSAAESAYFGAGRGNVGAAGAARQAACQDGRLADPLAQQECDAINYLSRNPSIRPRFRLDRRTDPLLTGSAATLANPGPTPGTPSQQCRVVTVDRPGSFTSRTCTEAYGDQTLHCQRIATPTVSWQSACSLVLQSSTVNGMTSSGSIACGAAEPLASLSLGTVASQCHGGGCNSDYYPFDMDLSLGTPSSHCAYLAVNYKGQSWQHVCGYYDGAQTVSFYGDFTETLNGFGMPLVGRCKGPLTEIPVDLGHGQHYIKYSCDHGFTWPSLVFSGGWSRQPQVDYGWNDLCAALEARAQ